LALLTTDVQTSFERKQQTVGAFIDTFAYLNFKYLVAAFYRLGHPLRERLGVLGALNMGHCIGGYSDVLSLDIVPSESFTRHELPALSGTPLVEGHVEKKLANVQEAIYSLVAPCDLLSVTSGYCASCIKIIQALMLRLATLRRSKKTKIILSIYLQTNLKKISAISYIS
jgi:hypothetical protein